MFEAYVIRRHFVNASVLASAMLWAYGVSLSSLKVNSLGLFNSFNFSFYVSLSLMVLASLVESFNPRQRTWIHLVAIIVVLTSISLIPTLIGGTQRAEWATISSYRQVEAAISDGRVTNSIPNLYLGGGFPSVIYLFSSFFQVTNIPQLVFVVTFLDMFWNLLYLPFFIILARQTLERELVWPFVWFLYLIQWLSFNGIEAQTPGYFGFLVLLTLIILGGTSKHVPKVFFLLISALIVTSHGLSALFMIGVMFSYYIFTRSLSSRMLIASIAMLSAWMAYIASVIIVVGFPAILQFVFNPVNVLQYSLFARVSSPDASHFLLNIIRVSYTAAYTGAAAIGIVVIWFKRHIWTKQYLSVLAGVAVVGLVVGYAYGAEIIDKSLLFAGPCLAFLGVQLFRVKHLKYGLLLLLVVSPAAFVISAYGGQMTDLIPSPEFDSFSYFQTYAANSGTLTGNILTWTTPTFPYSYGTAFITKPSGAVPVNTFLLEPSSYTGLAYEQLNWAINAPIFPQATMAENHYIAVSLLDYRVYAWIYNDTQFIKMVVGKLNSETNLVYSSPDMSIWYSE